MTVNWIIPSINEGNYVTYYDISYTPSCPELSSVNVTVPVAPHQSTTTYSYTLRGLSSGMNYAITVRAGNVLGESKYAIIVNETVQTGKLFLQTFYCILSSQFHLVDLDLFLYYMYQ